MTVNSRFISVATECSKISMNFMYKCLKTNQSSTMFIGQFGGGGGGWANILYPPGGGGGGAM